MSSTYPWLFTEQLHGWWSRCGIRWKVSSVIEVTGKASWGRSSPLCHQEEVWELSSQSCLERAPWAPPAVKAAAGGIQGGPQALHRLLPTGCAQDWCSTKLCNPFPFITVPSSGKRKHRDSLSPRGPHKCTRSVKALARVKHSFVPCHSLHQWQVPNIYRTSQV